jgi:hypothetical protein
MKKKEFSLSSASPIQKVEFIRLTCFFSNKKIIKSFLAMHADLPTDCSFSHKVNESVKGDTEFHTLLGIT